MFALRALVFAAPLAGVLSFSVPAMAGESPGLNGFALCTSKAPKEIGYVKGSRVYLSDVFQVRSSEAGADYQNAYAAFLKQKYHFSGPLNCSVAWAKPGQVKTLDQRVQTVGSLAVRTGWAYENAPAASVSTTAPAPAAQNNGTTGGMYFVCTWPTSAAGALTYYVSDVNGVPPGVEPGPFLGELAPAFGKYVAAKYHAEGGGYNCVYQFSKMAAEALKHRYLTTWVPHGYSPVDTGWVYKGSDK